MAKVGRRVTRALDRYYLKHSAAVTLHYNDYLIVGQQTLR